MEIWFDSDDIYEMWMKNACHKLKLAKEFIFLHTRLSSLQLPKFVLNKRVLLSLAFVPGASITSNTIYCRIPTHFRPLFLSVQSLQQSHLQLVGSQTRLKIITNLIFPLKITNEEGRCLAKQLY